MRRISFFMKQKGGFSRKNPGKFAKDFVWVSGEKPQMFLSISSGWFN
jgi:hypothetical protein